MSGMYKNPLNKEHFFQKEEICLLTYNTIYLCLHKKTVDLPTRQKKLVNVSPAWVVKREPNNDADEPVPLAQVAIVVDVPIIEAVHHKTVDARLDKHV